MKGVDISDDSELPDLRGIGALALTAVFLGGAAGLVFVLRALPHAFSFLDRSIENKNDLGTLCAALALGVGIALYQLRRRMRWLYAALELCFAFATAWVAVARLRSQGEMSVWFGFMGAAYLVVRGLDNLRTAREEGNWPWQKAFAILTGTSRLPIVPGEPAKESFDL